MWSIPKCSKATRRNLLALEFKRKNFDWLGLEQRFKYLSLQSWFTSIPNKSQFPPSHIEIHSQTQWAPSQQPVCWPKALKTTFWPKNNAVSSHRATLASRPICKRSCRSFGWYHLGKTLEVLANVFPSVVNNRYLSHRIIFLLCSNCYLHDFCSQCSNRNICWFSFEQYSILNEKFRQETANINVSVNFSIRLIIHRFERKSKCCSEKSDVSTLPRNMSKSMVSVWLVFPKQKFGSRTSTKMVDHALIRGIINFVSQ